MDIDTTAHHKLSKLRAWRNRKEYDQSLGFLNQQFKSQIERPYKQLSAIAKVWETSIPKSLASHTRLESLQNGTLTVQVDSSAMLYQVDRLLRNGLEARLRASHRRLTRVKIKRSFPAER